MVTSNYIIDETITLARMNLGHSASVKIGQKLWSETIANLVRVTPQDEENAWEIFVKYQDKTFSFTDCTSFALMERVGIIEVFSFDSHFTQYGDLVVLPTKSNRSY